MYSICIQKPAILLLWVIVVQIFGVTVVHIGIYTVSFEACSLLVSLEPQTI